MPSQNGISELRTQNFAEFRKASHKLAESALLDPNWADKLVLAIETLGTSELPISEKHRRIQSIVRTFQETGISFNDIQLVSRLGKLAGPFRSGIASALPQEMLGFFYGNKATQENDPVAGNNNGCTKEDERPHVEGHGSNPEVSRPLEIILLSALDNQEANRRQFDLSGFPTFRVTDDVDLQRYLSTPDVCGFVVDGSFWIGKDPQYQEQLLKSIAAYSSLSCLYIDRTNFTATADVHQIVEDVRGGPVSARQLQVRDSSLMSGPDIQCFVASAKLFEPQSRPLIIHDHLSAHDSLVLFAVTTLFFLQQHCSPGEELRTINVEVLQARTGEPKLLLLRFNGTGIPVIAKIGPEYLLRNEYDRFNTFVRAWDNQLKPFYHAHAHLGVIIFGLVEDGTQPFRPAPTLESRLRGVWQDEIWGCRGSAEREAEALVRVVERAVSKLKSLNNIPCGTRSHSSYAILQARALTHLTRGNAMINLPELSGRSVRAAILQAYRLVKPLRLAATVHGDTHLANILVRDNGIAHIIDYATSGPGHPCHDLLMLECALLCRFFRCLGTEDDFVALQRSFSLRIASYDIIVAAHSVWFGNITNQMLLRGAVIARDACLEVIGSYRGGLQDYVAAKFLLCCHAFTIPELQMGLVRGIIRALAPELIDDLEK